MSIEQFVRTELGSDAEAFEVTVCGRRYAGWCGPALDGEEVDTAGLDQVRERVEVATRLNARMFMGRHLLTLNLRGIQRLAVADDWSSRVFVIPKLPELEVFDLAQTGESDCDHLKDSADDSVASVFGILREQVQSSRAKRETFGLVVPSSDEAGLMRGVCRLNFKRLWDIAPFDVIHASEKGALARFRAAVPPSAAAICVNLVHYIAPESIPVDMDLVKQAEETGDWAFLSRCHAAKIVETREFSLWWD